jgi:two-component system OmpR family response regulator
VLRRSKVSPAAASVAPSPTERVATFGVFCFTPAQRKLTTLEGTGIDLTGAEYNLLAAFVDRPNRVLTRDAIADLIQHAEADSFDRSIDTLVSRLRRKLEPHTDATRLIQTVRGEGYVLASPVTWTAPSNR